MTIETLCQRSAERKRVLMTAIIVTAQGSLPARVSELTEHGARISCDWQVAPGSDVIFKRGETFAAARVAWSDAGGAGLAFYRELDAQKIAA